MFLCGSVFVGASMNLSSMLAIFGLLSIIIMIVCAVIVLFRTKTLALKGVKYFIALIFSFVLGNIFYILQYATNEADVALFALKMQTALTIVSVCFFIVFFLINLPDYKPMAKSYPIFGVTLALVNIFFDLLNPHNLMFGDYYLTEISKGTYTLYVEFTPTFYVFQIILYSLFLTTVGRMVFSYIKKAIKLRHALLMLTSVLVPISCNILYILGITKIDYTNVVIFISAIALTYSVLRFGTIDTTWYLQRNMLSLFSDPLFVLMPDGKIEYANIVAENLIGKKLAEIRNKQLFEVDERFPEDITSEIIHFGDTVFNTTHSTLSDEKKKVYGTLIILHNITNVINAENKIEYLTKYDTVTGLINSDKFEKMVEDFGKAHEGRLKGNFILAVAVKNAEYLKGLISVEQENQIFVYAAKYIAELVPGFLLSKYRENEYCLFTQGISIDFSSLYDLFERTKHKTFLIDGQSFDIEFCMGVYYINDKNVSAKTAISNALFALKYVFERSQNIALYNSSMSREHELKKNILGAIQNIDYKNDFFLEFQPIVDIKNNKIVAAEALLRWNHPIYGQLSPAVFIPVLENANQIEKLGYAVIGKACDALYEFEKYVSPDFKLSVNVSKKQIDNYGFVTSIKELIAKKHVNSARLDFEITETATSSKLENVIDFCKKMKEMGSSISLDDFGSGDTSVAYISELGINKVKLDTSLSQSTHTNEKRRIVVKSLLNMFDELGIPVVVEHIDSVNALASFKNQGFALIQGYIYSRPLKLNDFKEYYIEFGTEVI